MKSVIWRRCEMVLLGLALVATAAAQSTLRRGAFGEPESLQPNMSGVSSENTILLDLFEGLTSYDAAGRLIAGAAESWRASADGLTWTFNLRPGLHWSDGSALTAADFIYALQRTMTPAVAAPRATRLYVIKGAANIHRGAAAPTTLGAHATNATTIEINLEHALPWLPWLLAGQEGFPQPQSLIARVGSNWTRAGVMISNGAFALAERAPRGAISLRRNRYYHDAAAVALDNVIYLPSDDTNTLLNRFRAGELDVNGWPGYPPERAAWARQNLGAAAHASPILGVRYLRFNVMRAPFDDARIRLALSLAIDRDTLVGKALGNNELVSLRVAPMGIPDDHEPANNPLALGNFATRQERARQLLIAAKYAVRHPAPITLRAPAGNNSTLCIAIAAMWGQAGVRTHLAQSEIKSMIADLRRGDFDVALTGAQDPTSYESFLDRFRAASSYNTGRYNSPAFEQAMDAAQQLADPRTRATALSRAESILQWEQPVAPLIQEIGRNLVAARVTGWVDNPIDIHLSRYLRVQ